MYGRWDDCGLRLPGGPDVLRRVVDDETVSHRIAEDRGEDPKDGLDRCGCEHLGAPPNPGLHLARSDRGERTIAERREHVVAEVRVDLDDGRSAVHLRVPPRVRVVAECDSTSRWIDVGAVEDLALDAGQESLGRSEEHTSE